MRYPPTPPDHYWYPFHPYFRWPLRIMGLLFVIGYYFERQMDNIPRLSVILIGCLFILHSFADLKVRRRTTLERIISWLILTFLIGLAIYQMIVIPY
jgi:hypothetical protein